MVNCGPKPISERAVQYYFSQFTKDQYFQFCLKLSMAYDKIETQLTLLGATGVEDKLQVGVPQTICALREAGIKVKYSEEDLCFCFRLMCIQKC